MLIARQADRINFWMQEVAQAWERSKQDDQTRIERTSSGEPQANGAIGPGKSFTETRTHGKAGDPALVGKIIDLMAREAALFGLDAAKAKEGRAHDAAAAVSIAQLMMLAEKHQRTQAVSGPPLIGYGYSEPTEELADADIKAAITVTVPIHGGNYGNSPEDDRRQPRRPAARRGTVASPWLTGSLVRQQAGTTGDGEQPSHLRGKSGNLPHLTRYGIRRI